MVGSIAITGLLIYAGWNLGNAIGGELYPPQDGLPGPVSSKDPQPLPSPSPEPGGEAKICKDKKNRRIVCGTDAIDRYYAEHGLDKAKRNRVRGHGGKAKHGINWNQKNPDVCVDLDTGEVFSNV